MASTNELRELDCGDITCDLDSYEAGAGGFGDVIIGFHEGLQQDVAIKVFAITGGPVEKARLEKTIKEEIQHLQKADHENVVRIFGYVKWPFTMGFVMEYCKGGSLKELLLDTSIELGLGVRVRFLYQTSSGMAFCHNLPDKRLIHQDLKPDNIMLTEELQCKIIDFGAAELATHSSLATVNPLARSKKEKPQYTAYYTAPEKLKDPAIKPKTKHDVYSLSIIIYMVLSRTVSYPNLEGEQLRKLLQLIENGKRPDCQKIQDWIQTLVGEDREVAEQLQLLMKRCWDQDPTKRPTMTEISEELKNLLEKQNPENLLSQVESVAREMVVNQPSTNESQRVPLHHFSPRTGRFEVPSTTSSRTTERSTEPPAGAQGEGSSEQGEIPTSSRSQQPDSIEGTESREANTSIEITQPKTSSAVVLRDVPPTPHLGETSTLRKVKRRLRKLFGFKTEKYPTFSETSDSITFTEEELQEEFQTYYY